MKADISIVQSKKGTGNPQVSGNLRFNKYGNTGCNPFTVPIFGSCSDGYCTEKYGSCIIAYILWSCALAGFGVNLLLHALFFGIFFAQRFPVYLSFRSTRKA